MLNSASGSCGQWEKGIDGSNKELLSAESVNCSVLPNSLQPHGLQPIRPLCPWNSPGKNTGVGGHSLLQVIFLTQR